MERREGGNRELMLRNAEIASGQGVGGLGELDESGGLFGEEGG